MKPVREIIDDAIQQSSLEPTRETIEHLLNIIHKLNRRIDMLEGKIDDVEYKVVVRMDNL